MRDPWAEKYQREVYERVDFNDETGCRPATEDGVLLCPRPVVRDGRCILHAPKLTREERAALTESEAREEAQFEAAFAKALLEMVGAQKLLPSGIDFQAVHFTDIAWNQPPWLNVLSGHFVNFTMAVFHRQAIFPRFGKEVWFTKSVFRDHAAFVGFDNGVHFNSAVFEGPAQFSGTHFNGWVNFHDAHFEKSVEFSWPKVHGRIWFKGVDGNSVFADDAKFSRLEVAPSAEVIFEDVSLEKASFLNCNIEPLKFLNVRWCGATRGHGGRMSTRKRLWDEQRIQAQGADPGIRHAIAENYRQLVRSYEARRDFDLAEDFHIGEMEMRRIGAGPQLPRSLGRVEPWLNAYALYRFLSVYGTSYWRALGILICMVLFVSTVFLFTGLAATGPPTIGSSPLLIKYHFPAVTGEPRVGMLEVVRDFGQAFVNTLSVLTFQRERSYRAASAYSQAFEAIASIFLTGQTAMLLLAIRRRFKR